MLIILAIIAGWFLFSLVFCIFLGKAIGFSEKRYTEVTAADTWNRNNLREIEVGVEIHDHDFDTYDYDFGDEQQRAAG